jgi:hypothetical protein
MMNATLANVNHEPGIAITAVDMGPSMKTLSKEKQLTAQEESIQVKYAKKYINDKGGFAVAAAKPGRDTSPVAMLFSNVQLSMVLSKKAARAPPTCEEDLSEPKSSTEAYKRHVLKPTIRRNPRSQVQRWTMVLLYDVPGTDCAHWLFKRCHARETYKVAFVVGEGRVENIRRAAGGHSRANVADIAVKKRMANGYNRVLLDVQTGTPLS